MMLRYLVFSVRLQHLISNLDSNLESQNSNGLLNALCNLFVQYEFAEQSVLPPTGMIVHGGNFSFHLVFLRIEGIAGKAIQSV